MQWKRIWKKFIDLTYLCYVPSENPNRKGTKKLKKIAGVSPIILCVLYLILPLCKIIGAVFGYRFSLRNYSAAIILLAALSLTAMAFLFLTKASLSSVSAVFSALLPAISAVSGLFFALSDKWKGAVVMVLLCYGCCMAILIKFAQPVVLKIIMAVFSALLLLFLLLAYLAASFFNGFGRDTVVKSLPSPQQTYVAEVIDSDQGALGGNTIVEVQNQSKTVDLYFGKFSKPPVRVYFGAFGEFENMQIQWGDEHTLIIEGKEYDVSK